MKPWERYESLVDDPDAFRAACERSLPTAVRVNPIKTTPAETVRALTAEDIGVTRRGWNDHTLILDTDRPGLNWPYQHGWIHGQEEISQLPARIVDPDPDAIVWDVAAAPGGKATQLAAAVDPAGLVIANDVNLGRLAALRSNADRQGITNMAVTRQDASMFSLDPFDVDGVDCALVDAPCTGEGTLRKNPDALREWSIETVHGLASVQCGILKRAIELTRPGGTVVYSTCTFAPEENEGVLATVLDEMAVSIEPFRVDLDHEPGVQSWGGAEYPPEVRHLQRFYPHLNDTGGFTCAKLVVDE